MTLSHDGFFLVCNSDEDKILLFDAQISFENLSTAFSYKERDNIIEFFIMINNIRNPVLFSGVFSCVCGLGHPSSVSFRLVCSRRSAS